MLREAWSSVKLRGLELFASTLVPAVVFALAPIPICSLLAAVPFLASSILAVALLVLVSFLTFLLATLTTASITITITIPLREGCWIRSDKHPKAEQQRQANTNENISC